MKFTPNDFVNIRAEIESNFKDKLDNFMESITPENYAEVDSTVQEWDWIFEFTEFD